MNDLKRLIDSSDSGATRTLLRSALDDEPPANLLPRLALTLGVAAPAATLLVPSSAVASKAITAGVSAAGVGKATVSLSLVELSKWLAAGVLGGAFVSAAAVTVDRLRPEASSTAAVRSPAREVAPPARAAAREAEAPRAPDVELPSPPPAPVTSAKSPAQGPTPESPRALEPLGPSAIGDSRALGREAARIDAARRALATGDLGLASRELDAYSRERVVGVLDREAELLRIQIQVRSGDESGARARARRYLEQNPNDAHAARLREIAYPAGTAR